MEAEVLLFDGDKIKQARKPDKLYEVNPVGCTRKGEGGKEGKEGVRREREGCGSTKFSIHRTSWEN